MYCASSSESIKMRILFVIAHIGKGGGQVTQSLRLIKELSKNHDTTLLTLKFKTGIVDEPCRTIYAGPLKFPHGIYYLWKKLISIKYKFDVIQCLDGYYALPAVFFSGKRPFYLRLGQSTKGDFINRGHKFLAPIADVSLFPLFFSNGFVVNSRELQKEMWMFKPKYIPNGYDLNLYSTTESKKELRKRLGIPASKYVVLYTGKVLNSKNVNLVFDAIQNMEDTVAVIVGEVSKDFVIPKNQGNLIFKGEVHMDKVRDYLFCSDAFIFPSPKESSPNSLLEAMAARLPVICSDIPNHREIVKHRKNGLLFSSTHQLIECINLLKKDKKKSIWLGKNAYNHILKNHDIKKTARRYLRLYLEK